MNMKSNNTRHNRGVSKSFEVSNPPNESNSNPSITSHNPTLLLLPSQFAQDFLKLVAMGTMTRRTRSSRMMMPMQSHLRLLRWYSLALPSSLLPPCT